MTVTDVTTANGDASGTVPATLSLTLGRRRRRSAPSRPASRSTYTASTTANVISTAGDATLSVADPSSATGHLVNGTFSLPQPLQASERRHAGTASTSASARR